MTPDSPVSEHLPACPMWRRGGPPAMSRPARWGSGGRAGRRPGVMAPQRRHDVRDGLPCETLVYPITLCNKVTRGWFDGVRGDRAVDSVGDDCLRESRKLGVRDVVIGETHCNCVGPG